MSKRRGRVTELVREEERFEAELEDLTERLAEMEGLSHTEICGVSLEKCQQLTFKYQVSVTQLYIAPIIWRHL